MLQSTPVGGLMYLVAGPEDNLLRSVCTDEVVGIWPYKPVPCHPETLSLRSIYDTI